MTHPTTTEGARGPTSRQELMTLIGYRASGLAERYLNPNAPGHSGAQAMLARLRGGIDKPIGQIPEILGITIDGLRLPGNGDRDTPYASEIAAYTAVTLFALHQQSQTEPMHMSGPSLGKAAGQLRRLAGDNAEGIVRRFNALSTAVTMEEAVYHARRLVVLLRSAGIPLDYGRFAADLLDLQIPSRRDGVLLRWGRDFYRTSSEDLTSADKDATTPTEES